LVAAKILILAILFVLSGGTFFVDRFKGKKYIAALALIVSIASTYYLSRSIYQDLRPSLEADESVNSQLPKSDAALLQQNEEVDVKKVFSRGHDYRVGNNAVQSDKVAAQFYLLAAKNGYAPAQINLGISFSDGTGVPQNYSEAFKWFNRAANQGAALGQYYVSKSYVQGRGVGQDESEAFRWMQKAAKKYGSAVYSLGVYYEKGIGVKADFDKALHQYRKAAQQGIPGGQVALGLFHLEVKKDYSEAAKWFQRAANQGNSQGQHNMGFLYDNGYGVVKNLGEAIKWYQAAATQGSPLSIKRLAELGISN